MVAARAAVSADAPQQTIKPLNFKEATFGKVVERFH